MKFHLVIGCLLLQLTALSQPTRREIIGNRILAVESKVYDRTGKEMSTQKNYYSSRGSDSLELYDGKPFLSFKETLDAGGRVKKLVRYDQEGKEDEYHLYEYNDTGYTIEVVAQGTGTIEFAVYNLEHDCLQKIISSTDTFYFSATETGKIAKVAQKDSGLIRDIAVTEFDTRGFPLVMRSLDDFPYIMRFLYNDQGLPVEKRNLKMNKANEQLVLKIKYAYEFRQD